MKTHILTAAVALAVGAASAWWLAPRRVEVRTEYKDRWRTITVKETTRKKTRTTTKPDGTKIVEQTETRQNTDTKSAGTSVATTVSTPAPRWNVSLLGGVDLKLQPVGGAHVTYRVAGPFTAGAWLLGGPGVAAGGVSLGVTF